MKPRHSSVIQSALALAMLVAASANAAPGDFFEYGIIPPDAPNGPIAKCENRVAKATGKLAASLLKCRIALVMGKYFNDEEMDVACKQPAIAKFESTKIDGCAPCTNLSSVAYTLQAGLDYGSGGGLAYGIYCAALTEPCSREGASCTCTSGPYAGESSSCIADIDGASFFCWTSGGCAPNLCSQDSDCDQTNGPAACAAPAQFPGSRCCYQRCDY